MPEPILPPPPPPAPLSPPPTSQPSAEPPPPVRPRLAGWRKVLVIVAFIAAGLRLIMFLLLHFPAHHAAPLPTFPFHAGDVFTFIPGDANLAKWAQNPDADGFVVQQLPPNQQPLAAPTFCALQPDYMADAQQPGGTLTLLSQPLPDTWQVRWSGGNTLPPYIKKKGDFDANCGTNALLLMNNDQLHTLHDILAGISTSAPPTSVPPTK
jgi:hypothetical protein